MKLVSLFEQVFMEASKERFINKNEILSQKEKDDMISFYKRHPNLDSEGIDWQGKWTYSDFLDVKNKYEKDFSFPSLTKGEDYLYFGESNGLKYFVPLSWSAFDTMAPDSPWCISDPWKWDEYIEKGSYFILVFDEKSRALCIEFTEDDMFFWNEQDESYGFNYTELNNTDIFDFTKCNVLGNFANAGNHLAFIDTERFGEKIDKSILSKIDKKTNLILRKLEENS